MINWYHLFWSYCEDHTSLNKPMVFRTKLRVPNPAKHRAKPMTKRAKFR